MFQESVIRKTQQWWKLLLGVFALGFGSFAPLFDAIRISWTTGTVIACLGYGFAVAFIRCPNCELRWFWRALLYSEMYAPLFTKPLCPSCHHDFGSRKVAD
jgi:hypothetical protein